MRGYSDGQQWFRRIVGPKNIAVRERNELIKANLLGLWWDPIEKTFIDAPKPAEETTVVELALRFWETNVPVWAPATRARNAFALRVLVAGLTTHRNTIEDDDLKKLFVPDPPHHWDEIDSTWPTLVGSSALSVSVTVADLDRVLFQYRQKASPKPATIRRVMSTVKSCFAFGVSLGSVHQPNPAESVTIPTVSRQKGEVHTLAVRPSSIDRRRVISPDQAIDLSEAVSARYRAFILIQAFCGLRPGEATAARTADVDLSNKTITIGRTTVLVPDQWLTDDDPSQDAPLKHRSTHDKRTIPIPDLIVDQMEHHLDVYADDPLLFTTPTGTRIDLSNFRRDEWAPAVKVLGPDWSHLRRHDLRHTACTLWLNAGISPSVAVQYSGHRSLSTFLDIYQGVMTGEEEASIEKLNRALDSKKTPTEVGADLLAP